MAVAVAAAAALGLAFLLYHLCFPLFISPLAKIPGPNAFAFTRWRLALEDFRGTRTRTIHILHKKYGPVVRLGPSEVSFNSVSALRTIYGAGSGFERTSFYNMFQVYGRKNMFSFFSGREHSERKKMFANAYAKSAMLKGANAAMVEAKVRQYLDLIARQEGSSEIFASLHYFSLDAITDFLYGKYGRTSCLEGSEADCALVNDIVDVARRRLSWFTVHLPRFTAWLYSRTGLFGRVARYFYPMQLPTTYTGIRRHAMIACQEFACGSPAAEPSETVEQTSPFIAKLWKHHCSRKTNGGLDDVDIASECADHLLAGIDTTSDTLMFLIWSLSRSESRKFQQKLIDEVRSISHESLNPYDIPTVETSDKLPYVNAVIKETLRLYAPLPASEPRQASTATVIDGYHIPAGTTVSISPYILHRNPKVFPNPTQFNPDRWIDPSENTVEMNRWFWAFSSGSRMCIGVHLAMAEMTTLVTAVYRKYTTTTVGDFDKVSPGITSRYEVFYDEGCSGVKEHECHIRFDKLAT
ncbi:hypothetical protein COCC4DRAFT_77748 [Bipolaris maydis ATCC 48331]|uniref:Benzoate 4-monooxygenase cytochrome P450 n=2 Tax=Cochliobolus heterostrophus TaxID=5016 RepID=M2UCM6_COCH5|nr:uncharacterized protein COCC4DRAFT_77748 [Bipolaris maydis ATCC 48331]EMD96314.1 hypothetical protein COCHEDRAFT_1201140 [Bipolaris maydis C5]KAH7562143.1 hypothetical protein BM1_03247 [Bipolaris maydis]ENI11174.1 hypothetical protein COCC4DRAFT_77748 [Bipolaris maydis ATCC 48331]KAJ5030968.1 cytochrome P450 [Bipolaris maydis]KAJ5065990.1 cytochrome protein [Bipolaris maydis]